MKTMSLVLILYFGFNLAIFSQDYLQPKIVNNRYVAKLKIFKSKEAKVGYLKELNDTSVLLSEFTDFEIPKYLNIDVAIIDNIQLRKNGNPGIGECTLYGFLAGASLGAIIGFASGDDPYDVSSLFSHGFTAGDKAILTGTILGGTGALIGLLVGLSSNGSSRITIHINGKLSNYLLNKHKLARYTY